MFRNGLILSFVLILAVAVIFWPVFDKQESEPVYTVTPVIIGAETSLLTTPIWVAEEKGYFLEEGVEAIIKPFDSGKASFEAMLKGEVDLSTVAPTPIMFNSFRRDDFSIIASFVYSHDDVKVIARKDSGIKTANDLRGKRIGIRFGTTGQFFLAAYLDYNGIGAEQIEAVDIAPYKLPKALEVGQVDAIIVWEPHARNAQILLGQQAVRLPSSQIYKEYFNLMAGRMFTQNNSELLERILRAIHKASIYAKNNPLEAQAIITEKLGLPPNLATSLWDEFYFGLSMDQSLLLVLKSEARWAMESGLVESSKIPDYHNYFYHDAIKVVAPHNLNIF